MVLRFKWVKNLSKVVFIFNWVNNEVIRGFKVQMSQEWSCKGFRGSND